MFSDDLPTNADPNFAFPPLKDEIERMLEKTKRNYNHAAAMHSDHNVSYESGKRDAFEAVLKLIG